MMATLKNWFLLLTLLISCISSTSFLATSRKLGIVLLGLPGAGKSTQAQLLAQELQFPDVSPGKVLREEVQNQTKIGLEAQDCVRRGEFVDDEIILEIMANYISKHETSRGYIFDGFPRTLRLAKAFFEKPVEPMRVIVFTFKIDESEVIKRIANRGDSRVDDNQAAIRNRLSLYQEHKHAVVHYFENSGFAKVVTIDANQPKKDIQEQISHHIDEVNK